MASGPQFGGPASTGQPVITTPNTEEETSMTTKTAYDYHHSSEPRNPRKKNFEADVEDARQAERERVRDEL